jgi:hypothetical protein
MSRKAGIKIEMTITVSEPIKKERWSSCQLLRDVLN